MSSWRPREDRTTVRIRVRVRTDAGWVEATIRNISSRGMMLQSEVPLERDQLVEITRGRTRVVGRVMWSEDATFGLRADDSVDLAALLGGSGDIAAGAAEPTSTVPVRCYVALDSASGFQLMGRAT